MGPAVASGGRINVAVDSFGTAVFLDFAIFSTFFKYATETSNLPANKAISTLANHIFLYFSPPISQKLHVDVTSLHLYVLMLGRSPTLSCFPIIFTSPNKANPNRKYVMLLDIAFSNAIPPPVYLIINPPIAFRYRFRSFQYES